jgi:hypothetical protein
MSGHRNGVIVVLLLSLALLAATDTRGQTPVTGIKVQTPVTVQPASATFELAPPEIEEIVLLPRAKTDAGNTDVAVTFKSDAMLSPAVKIAIAGAEATLSRSPVSTRQFNATLNFNFETFIAEQERRANLARQYTSVPVFTGRELTGHQPIQFIDPAFIRSAVANQIPIHVSPTVFTGIPYAINPAQELMITDLSIVQDPTRTFDVCTGQGTPGGAWTFGKLMTDMANQAATGVDPADFVEKWLKTWETTQTVNGFPVAARPNIDTDVINLWPRVNGKLDLTKAPMRLLAIVNRVDLRTGGAYVPGKAGEGRFVFGVVANNGANGCNALSFTVILEYGVPITGCTAIRAWGQQWHALGSIALGTPSFNSALQAITDTFAKVGADPSKTNGSALDQLRTDEIALAFPWELRQFDLSASDHLLHVATVAQTPDLSLNGTATLTSYIQTFQAQIANGTYKVPATFPGTTPFLGGSSLNEQTVWNGPGIPTNAPPPPNPLNDARHLLALGTCNGCHGTETQTGFLQVFTRAPGAASQLSRFLLGDANGTLLVPDTETVADPVSGVPRVFGDLLRRQTDLDALINQSCVAGGLLSSFSFRPLNMAD